MITEVEFDYGQRDGGFADISLTPRPPGDHITNVIYDLEAKLFPDKEREPYDDLPLERQREIDAYREMGFMWERVFTGAFRERQFTRRRAANDALILQEPIKVCRHAVQILHRPCPHGCTKGIWLSPDAVDTSYPPTLEEYKWTSKSASRVANLEVDFWSWFAQIKAYLSALGLTRARLFVLFSQGDYGKRRSPWPRRFDLEFPPNDLALNWNMQMAHWDRMRAA